MFFGQRERGQKIEELEDEADPVAPQHRQRLVVELRQVDAVDGHRPRRGPVHAPAQVQQGRLAASRRRRSGLCRSRARSTGPGPTPPLTWDVTVHHRTLGPAQCEQNGSDSQWRPGSPMGLPGGGVGGSHASAPSAGASRKRSMSRRNALTCAV